MNKILLLSFLFIFSFFTSLAQIQQQYFDGADTIFDPSQSYSSIKIIIDPDTNNIWQIGQPQKVIFDSAATYPNALVTDTINYYPVNNTSVFQFTMNSWWGWWGVFALQWKQKLDMDQGLDGGKIEYSIDGGTTWYNVFNNPVPYNFYGFQSINQDTLPNGDFVFSGTDTTWRDIWLCFYIPWMSFNDSMMFKFTFMSDSIDNNKEGWLIDNMVMHVTIIHTINEENPEKYITVYPNPTNNLIFIEVEKLQEFHIIEHMALINAEGKVVDKWNNIPVKYFIDARKYNSGLYSLYIKTNKNAETFPIMINNEK